MELSKNLVAVAIGGASVADIAERLLSAPLGLGGEGVKARLGSHAAGNDKT